MGDLMGERPAVEAEEEAKWSSSSVEALEERGSGEGGEGVSVIDVNVKGRKFCILYKLLQGEREAMASRKKIPSA